jgi:hypothetical protein
MRISHKTATVVAMLLVAGGAVADAQKPIISKSETCREVVDAPLGK